jgi:hypothetical protein
VRRSKRAQIALEPAAIWRMSVKVILIVASRTVLLVRDCQSRLPQDRKRPRNG